MPAREEIERLFEHAAALDPSGRTAFLETACAGDARLRSEVESLLALEEEAKDFLERPALELEAMAAIRQGNERVLLPGDRVGPYRVIALAGRGGMGEVYSAQDTRLQRRVALKFLPRRLVRNSQALERFQREARTASALNHPNICTIYDIGEQDGQPYIVMELLEGQTLKQRLVQGPLQATELVSIALQAVDALDAAHAKGIIHRDIKPANLFISTGGIVKMLDFGLAKLVSESPQPSNGSETVEPAGMEDSITLPGAVMGTAPYMSPEQIKSETLDARSDLFSLGATLYQAAVGALPFQGETKSEIAQAILSATPIRPRQLQPGLPPELERIILKALDKEAAMRYQSAKQLYGELRRAAGKRLIGRPWIWLAAAAALALGALIPAIISWRADSEPQFRRVAVLPIVFESAGEEHVAEEITDAISGGLAKLPGLSLISRASAMRYKGTKKNASEIGQELRVDGIIKGSAKSAGERLHVEVQLIRADKDMPVWAQSFHLELTGIDRLRLEVARAVARTIRLRLSPADDARLAKTGTKSREAFEAYLRGRHYWGKRTEADMERAVSYFRMAIDADPAYASAYASLADSYNQFGTVRIGRSPAEHRPLAMAAAQRAIEIDEESAEAHAALGFAKMYDLKWAEAEVALRRALDLNPSYGSARVWYAMYLASRERFPSAIAEVERAYELDPLSLITLTQVGMIYSYSGSDEQAVAHFQKVLAIDPRFTWALWMLTRSYINLGRFDEAVKVAQRSAEIEKDNPTTLGHLGEALALMGRKTDARRLQARLERMSQRRYVTPLATAYICMGLDDRGCVFRYLEMAYHERANYISYLRVMPSPRRYGALRADPRFQDLLRRLGEGR